MYTRTEVAVYCWRKITIVDGMRSNMENTDVRNDSGNGTRLTLMHFHVCTHCGHARQREEVEGREVGSGVLHCNKCNLGGPLNVEIQESVKLVPNPNGLQTKGSSGQR